MSANKKRLSAVAAGVAVAAVGAGAAWAAFGAGVDTAVAGSAEAVKEVVVDGIQVKASLLPGESSAVKLTVENPNTNVKAAIESITPHGVVVKNAVDADTKWACEQTVTQNTELAGTVALPLVLGKGASTTLTLPTGVTLGESAPLKCQGMQFETNWKVAFKAVR
jgi:hypothetical protein